MPNHCSPLGQPITLLKYIRDAIGLRCDVTIWEDQLKLFEAAMEAHHSVDIVVSSRPPSWSRYPRLTRLQGCQRRCERDWLVLETKTREWQASKAIHSHG